MIPDLIEKLKHDLLPMENILHSLSFNKLKKNVSKFSKTLEAASLGVDQLLASDGIYYRVWQSIFLQGPQRYRK